MAPARSTTRVAVGTGAAAVGVTATPMAMMPTMAGGAADGAAATEIARARMVGAGAGMTTDGHAVGPNLSFSAAMCGARC